MKALALLLLVFSAILFADENCPEQIEALVTTNVVNAEGAVTPSEVTQPISGWDPALKPPFPMGPLLFTATAAAPLTGGPWLYRKVYNPLIPNSDPQVYAYYDGTSQHLNFFEAYGGLTYYWTAILQISGNPMQMLKNMLADAAKQTVTSAPGPTPSYQIEYGGLDPVTGKTFILQSTGAKIQNNPSINTGTLIDLANRWCM